LAQVTWPWTPTARFFLRVSSSSENIRKVLISSSVVDVRGPQVFLTVRRVEDVKIKDCMTD